MKLADNISEKLLAQGEIDEQEYEVYQYGLHVLFSKIVFFLVTMMIGFALQIPVKSIIFYVVYTSIRKYAGGYHASTEMRCNILSYVTLVITMITMKNMGVYWVPQYLEFLGIIVLIYLLSPIDSENKRITDQERITYKRKIGLFLLCYAVMESLAYLFKMEHIFAAIFVSLNLEAILLIMGKTIRRERKE